MTANITPHKHSVGYGVMKAEEPLDDFLMDVTMRKNTEII